MIKLLSARGAGQAKGAQPCLGDVAGEQRGEKAKHDVGLAARKQAKGGMMVLLALVLATAAMPQAAFAGTYNRSVAVNYALRWANGRNPTFVYFENDCTNFISQALGEAGEQFDYRGTDPAGNWFWTSRYGYSKSWTVAHQLFNFIHNRGRGDIIGEGVGSNWGRHNELNPGDLIFASWTDNGWLDHVYIVTGRDSRGILVSAHSNDHRNMPFVDALNQARSQRWRFYYVRMRNQY